MMQLLKAAAELLQKYIRDGQVTDVNHSKIDKSSKGDLKNNVIRQPIGPGTSDKLIKEVEKTLPDGMHTAKGRRAMFKTYSSAMSTERGHTLGRIKTGDWKPCKPSEGELDQTCEGQKCRTIYYYILVVFLKKTEKECKPCLLTDEVVNGGYTAWSAWDDCSNNCNGKTNKYRTCHNPTPCNGGKDCSDLGANKLTKHCGPVDGQWGEWGPWGTCSTATGSSVIYGTGTYIRYRQCDNPPAACGGDYCFGTNSEDGNCRAVPPCLTSKIFEEKFLFTESAMLIYSSAKVDIYTLTKNRCTTATIIYNYWQVFRVLNETSGDEEQIGDKSYTLKFKVGKGLFQLGLYRLYVKIGYPESFNHWMEESMYFRIEHPPPHASIKGGAGRNIGEGKIDFDARTVSYSLTKAPGDPSGLTFRWKCLTFVTNSIYNLLAFNMKSEMVFSEEDDDTQKWYHTGFTNLIADHVAWVSASILYTRVKYYRSVNTTCKTADRLQVNINLTDLVNLRTIPTTITNFNHTLEFTTTTAAALSSDNSTALLTTTVASLSAENSTGGPSETIIQELANLASFYEIIYMVDVFTNPTHLRTSAVEIETPQYNTRVTNEIIEYLSVLYNGQTLFSTDFILTFFEKLSESALTLQSILQLRGLGGLPSSANDTFFEDLENWLQIAKDTTDICLKLVNVLKGFQPYQLDMDKAMNFTNIVGVDGFLHWLVDELEPCLLTTFGEIMEGMFEMNTHDWHEMKNTEEFYLRWMKDELILATECVRFHGYDDGSAELDVIENDINDGMGFLVYVRVEFEDSVSYFIQHAQTVTGNPPQLEIECKLNCMKKTALSAIISLKATCMSCSYTQLSGSKISWNVQDFDINSRRASSNQNWRDWMISDPNTREFVMRAGVLNASTGYLIESFMETPSGEVGLGIWTVYTNILPYNGSCIITDAIWDEKKVITNGWKDEGFRSTNDLTLDWKEQMNFRIEQLSKLGNSLLYYGFEEENYITVKPGQDVDEYEVIIKVQIFDIFIDFTECFIDLGQIFPNYTMGDKASASTFMNTSRNTIDYYWKSGDVKQVTMNAEVAGTPVKDLTITSTILDTSADQWNDLGVVTTENTTQIMTFDELWDMYQNPDMGDVDGQNQIIQTLSEFVVTLDNVSNAVDGTFTTKLLQVAYSIGTLISNKNYVDNSSAANAVEAVSELLQKLELLAQNETYPKYEDYISVCTGMLRVLNNALEGLLPRLSFDEPSHLDIYTIADFLEVNQIFTGEPNNSTSADLTSMEKAFIASKIAEQHELETKLKNDNIKLQVPPMIKAISKLGHVLHMLSDRKQMHVSVQNAYVNSTGDNRYIFELLKSGFHLDYVSIEFGESRSTSTQEQNIQVTLFDHTPFSWATESRFISSKTATVTIGTENETNTVIPSKIRLNNTGQSLRLKTVQLAIPVNTSEEASQIINYKLYWKNPNDDMVISIYNAINDLSHTVYIQKDTEPTADHYTLKRDITATDWVSNNDIKLIIGGGLFQKSTLVYVGIHLSSSTLGSGQTQSGPTLTKLVDYTIGSATVGCRVWDGNDWDKSSCKVNPSSTLNATICDCKNPPGNSFATTFYVPPNSIDFSTVFSKFDLADNAAVFSTVISLVIVYIFICIWAFHEDKKDIERWSVSFLLDNSPFDSYLYMLTVYTGLNRRAGTRSNIRFEVIDSVGKGSVRTLDDEKHQGFKAGSVRRFIMSTKKKIKRPSCIKIWHDNSGRGDEASWYLVKIIMEDIQTGEKYHFHHNRWLSLDDDEGEIDTIIVISEESELRRFYYLFNENSRNSLTDSHLWLSVTIRPEQSNFTRTQRLSCCLALLFLTMITNAMFYGQNRGDKISIGPIKLSLNGIYISFVSALIAAPPIIIVTYLFRNSRHRKTGKVVDPGIIFTSTGLPYCCRLLAFGIITAAIGVSGFFLILYSMEWGKQKSEEWLFSFILSFMESIFIVDPVKILLLSIGLSMLFKDPNESRITFNKSKLLVETKRHAPSTYEYCRGQLNNINACYPVKKAIVEQMRVRRKAELTARKTFELILFLMFLVVLYLISFSNRDPGWFLLKHHIGQQIIEFPHIKTGDTTQRFKKITSTNMFYDWLNDTVIPYMFPRVSINNHPLTAKKRIYVHDQENLRVGPIRLRQVRVGEGSCESVASTNTFCYSKYSMIDEDDKNYCVGWELDGCPNTEYVKNITSSSWKFVPASAIWGLPTNGMHSTYAGGGYIVEFVVNYNISKLLLADLYKYVWIDRKSQAVFTEFTIYNVGSNVFAYVSLLCEFPETGGVTVSSSIKPFRPYQHVGTFGVLVFICELIVLVVMLICAIMKVFLYYRKGKQAIRRFWEIIETSIIVLFFVCTAMYIARWVMINKAMERFKQNKNKFVNFSHIAAWDEVFNALLAVIVFLTTVRLLKILGYNKRTYQLGHVLEKVGKDLFGCFVMFLIVYTAFVVFGYLIFGRQVQGYRNMFASSATLTNAVIGKNAIKDLFTVQPVLGRAYYFLFVFFLLWVLMSMLISTLNVGITSVREQIASMSPNYGITNIVQRILSDFINMFVKFKSSDTTHTPTLFEESIFVPENSTTHKKRKKIYSA